MFIDLHIHSTYSDGSLTPKQIVDISKKLKVGVISITDHDSVAGIFEAIIEGGKCGVEVIPGIEFSTEDEEIPNEEVHIIGYYIDWEDETLKKQLRLFHEVRERRVYLIIEKLKALGINIEHSELLKIVGKGSATRLHFAKLMVDKGYVKNINEAFVKYLDINRPAYVPKFRFQTKEAIELIKKLNGISCLAHPSYTMCKNEPFIQKLVSWGLDGIEVWQTKYRKMIEMSKQLSEKFGLLKLGGSDCHGSMKAKKLQLGTQKLPFDIFIGLKERKLKIGEQVEESRASSNKC